MNQVMKAILSFFSRGEFDLQKSRRIMNMKKVDPKRLFYRSLEYHVKLENYRIPLRMYLPSKHIRKFRGLEKNDLPVILYFHGGGFVSGNLDTHHRSCGNLANVTEHIVLSVDYRLAPEFPFPTGLKDCYTVAYALFNGKSKLRVDKSQITIMGDSAGGNLAAAVCLLARDRKDFTPKRQILIYPCVDSDYEEDSKYPSVRECGENFLLTREDMKDYILLYCRTKKDYENPYFAPIKAKDFRNLPRTLIITGEFDPLRDEGEAYARKLFEAGNEVQLHRIANAVHGYFSVATKHFHAKEALGYIGTFLKEERYDVSNKKNKVEKTRKCSKDISCHK